MSDCKRLDCCPGSDFIYTTNPYCQLGASAVGPVEVCGSGIPPEFMFDAALDYEVDDGGGQAPFNTPRISFFSTTGTDIGVSLMHSDAGQTKELKGAYRFTNLTGGSLTVNFSATLSLSDADGNGELGEAEASGSYSLVGQIAGILVQDSFIDDEATPLLSYLNTESIGPITLDPGEEVTLNFDLRVHIIADSGHGTVSTSLVFNTFTVSI